jgi:hypothetical protein
MKKHVEYSYCRLGFKAEFIEPLQAEDSFRVNTPEGSFQMTKKEFGEVFSNVVRSESYAKGLYHYPTTPKKALQFVIKS